MKMNDIMNVIKELSFSQGFYGRLYREIMEIRDCDEHKYELIVDELESQDFREPLDVVLYFEC